MVAGAPRLLSQLLAKTHASKGIVLLPCLYDGLTARCIERAGFDAAFMTGFGVAAVAGHPDTGLLALGEMAAAARTVCAATRLPIIADGDTGYGNAINVKHTVRTLAAAGVAGIMIEDQVAPKRCGHTEGKAVVERDEALTRVRAACDARDELGEAGPLVMARTDARGVLGLEEAIERCVSFHAAGADMTFLEAPHSVTEMETYCVRVPGYKMANMLANGLTPSLPPEALARLGFTMAAYPLDLLNASIAAYERTLAAIREGRAVGEADALTFAHTQEVVGFGDYRAEEARYGLARGAPAVK
jgi:2-methylisocitrate lyase-like PEP mutase family enzyme